MVTDESEEDLLRSVVTQNAKSVRIARRRLERQLIEANEALARKTEELAGSEARYRSALRTGGMGNWETDLAVGTRCGIRRKADTDSDGRRTAFR